jgi:hypothetical protein
VIFSPDENWIAVAVGRHQREGKFKPADIRFESHLLILPLRESAGHPVQVEPGILLGEGSLAWAPTSDALVVQGMVTGTSEKIAEYERFLEGAPAAASAHGSRVVLTQSWVLGNNRARRETFSGGRVVWDFRSGAEVAA